MRLYRTTLSTLMSVWWWVGSDKGIIYWGEESSISVHWIRFLTDMPCFKCLATVHVGVCINNYRILPSNVVMVVHCMFSQCGHTGVTVCQCPSVFFNPELQCPSSFINIGHITRAAWNPINYSFPALLGYWILCVHKHLRQFQYCDQ